MKLTLVSSVPFPTGIAVKVNFDSRQIWDIIRTRLIQID